MSDDGPTITFGPSAAETVVNQFGWEFDDAGYLVDGDSGAYVDTYGGPPVHFDDFGGIVKVDGEAVPIRDNFADIVDWVSSHELAEDTPP